MKVETRQIDQVIPYSRNPRNNDAAVAAVASSIKEFKWRQPIVVDKDGVVVCGHTRLLAARQLGMTEVPVQVADDLTPAQIKAYRLLDNKSHEMSSWDFELLPLELMDLKALDFDLEMTGFSAQELDELLAPPSNIGLTDPDDVPAPPDEAITKRGEIIILGNHRLMCGDSANVEDVDRLLDGAMMHMGNLDPPYNVNVEPRSNNARAAGSKALPAIAKKKAHLQGFDDARTGKVKKTTTKRLERLELRQRTLAPPEINLLFSEEDNARWNAFEDEVIRRHPEVAQITDLDELATVMAWHYDNQFDEDVSVSAENPGITGVAIGGCA